MFKFIIENDLGEQFHITDGKDFSITKITGLNPPKATINTTPVVANDGEAFNSSKLNYRNIVLTLKILGNVEENRIMLYKYFKVKKYCKIYYSNGSRNVYIEGYVETFESDFFTKLQQIQIGIICPQPYFKDLDEIYFDISQVLSMFEFPFAIEAEGKEFSVLNKTLVATIENGGDTESGVIIEMFAKGQVINPKIYNTETRKRFGLNITMENGDTIIINTNKGEKRVTLVRDGVSTNVINKIMSDPEWFQLDVGDNSFTYDCDSGDEFFTVRFSYVNRYQGV